jgi:hypothetical protein
MFENIRAGIIAHKYAVIAATAATVLLATYFLPLNSSTDTALAQQEPNDNRFNVCEFPFDEDKPGKGEEPKKCYGISG